MVNNEIPELANVEQLKELVGDERSQYYAACYSITEVMLQVLNEKRRCVIFHGLANSGKSKIAQFKIN